MTEGEAPDAVRTHRWLADEMLGRLARYLRFFGWDTEYVRGLADDRVADIARSSGRILLTRDRALASRVDGSVLLRTIGVRDQMTEVFAAFPAEPHELRFDRCPEDNERLRAAAPSETARAERVPHELEARGLAVWTCPRCGRFYWEGSHATNIRAIVEEALERARAA